MKLLKNVLFQITLVFLTASASYAQTPCYFGFYASAMSGVGRGSYINEVSKISNFVHIREVDQKALVEKLELAKKNNLMILMDVQLYAYPWQSHDLNSDWKARLDSLLKVLTPYKKSVIGFYLYDEPYWVNIQPNFPRRSDQQIQTNLNAVARYLKSLWPEKKTGLTFAYKELGSNFLMPEQVDWIGFNCYAAFGSDCSDQKIKYYFQFLLKHKTSSQKLMITLDAFWNREPDRSDEQEILARLQLWKKMISSSTEVEVLLPFLYQNHKVENLWGVESLPKVAAWLKNYYLEIKQ